MMQTANLWKSDYLAYFGGLDRPWHGTVLTQRKVCARLVIVIQIGSENSPQVPFVQDDEVIKGHCHINFAAEHMGGKYL